MFQNFGTTNDSRTECKDLTNLLLDKYEWEEIADLYWEFREIYGMKYKNYAEILRWITKQNGRKAKKKYLYVGGKRGKEIEKDPLSKACYVIGYMSASANFENAKVSCMRIYNISSEDEFNKLLKLYKETYHYGVYHDLFKYVGFEKTIELLHMSNVDLAYIIIQHEKK